MRRCVLCVVVVVVPLAVACSAGLVWGQALGVAMPPEFEMRENAARRAMSNGEWMESLRQTCESLELLEDPKNRAPGWAFTKARFLMWKALILSELGVKDRALANYETAARVLVNQGNVGSNDPLWKALLEFVASDIHRPEFVGDEEGDPQRWRQALNRCGQELERLPALAPGMNQQQQSKLSDLPVMLGRQRIELARVCMFLAKQAFQERGNEAERNQLLQDAANYLEAAKGSFANHPDWQLVCDPKDPLTFRKVDDAEQQGVINQAQAVAVKEQILGALREWTNWRMAQAELQAQKEAEDPLLGWGFDKASVEFDKLLNFLAVQFGGDNHPVIYKTRLTRAKWYLGMARRDIRQGKLLEAPGGPLGPEEQLKRDQSYRRVITCLHDALTEVFELQNLEMATQLMKKGCVSLEKDVLEELLDVEANAKGIADVLEEEKRADNAKNRDRERIKEIKRLIAIKQFAADANQKVGSTGCPLKLPNAVLGLTAKLANVAGGRNVLNVEWKTPSGARGGTAKSYDVEISDDGGDTWKDAGSVQDVRTVIEGLGNGDYVVRVAGRNGAGRGTWTVARPRK